MEATMDKTVEDDAPAAVPSDDATGIGSGANRAKGSNGGAPAEGQGGETEGLGAAAAQAATGPLGTETREELAPDGGKPLDKISAVGHAAWLMTQSAPHKHLFLTDLEWLLMPPIAAGQFRLWRKENMPLAFASWAFLNEEAEQRLIAGRGKLAPAAWTGGDRLWLMDLIAPFGGREEALKELKAVVFPGRTMKSLNPDKDGKLQVVEW